MELRRKLYSLRLKEGDSVHSHIKVITDIYDSLSVLCLKRTELLYLLASFPESYSMLVTALEANADVPKMES